MARLRAKDAEIPTSREEADRLLADIGALQREVDRVNADLGDKVARAKVRAEESIKPLNAAIKTKFAALMAWAEANRGDLLTGGRRRVDLGQGTIGWRWAPRAVRLTAKVDLVIARLRLAGLDCFLRVSTKIDKDAILKNPEAVDGVEGIKVERAEQFWARPLDVAGEQVATVAKVSGADASTETGEDA